MSGGRCAGGRGRSKQIVSTPPPPAALPDRLRQSLEEPGAAAVIVLNPTQLRVWPERQLLYQPARSAQGMPLTAPATGALAEAESIELRDKDYPRAIILYKRLLADAKPEQRALLLHRVARAARKAGRDDA